MAREQVLAAAGVKGAHDIEKSVRIVVTSGLVNQERFSKGLRESLEPRLKAVSPLFRATATGHAWIGGTSSGSPKQRGHSQDHSLHVYYT